MRAANHETGEMIMLRMRNALAVLTVAVIAGGCDFDVENPGPTPDSFLDSPEAHQAYANGAALELMDALNQVAYTTSAVTRELFPAGSTSSFGISANQQVGRLLYDDEHADSWTPHQRSRYIAESGFERFSAQREGNINGYRPSAEAALWAGYANRLLGENWCRAVIDGGEEQDGTVWLERAEQWFTTAIEVAGASTELETVAMAAHAGRASVRAFMGDWAGAMQDAAVVPDDFVFQLGYHNTQQSHYNRIYFAGANQPYRAVTVWNTVYEDYYEQTGDPRTPWGLMDGFPEGDAALAFLNNQRVPFYQQQKYDDEDDDINLSSGREMRLLEAENQLRGGNWQVAMDAINARRSALGVPELTATTLEEAWTHYKRERGIELWLEGRRLGDLRRWERDGVPGDLHPLEEPGNPASYLVAERSLCYDIPQNERQSNPNVPDQP
jgi:hypothetical protein